MVLLVLGIGVAAAIVLRALRGTASLPQTLLGVVVAGAFLRLPGLLSGLPYYGYVDEGHVLRPATRMIALRTLDPGWWRYGSFLPQTTALSAGAYGALPGSATVNPGIDVVSSPYYDLGVAPATIVTGRLIVMLASIGLLAALCWLGWRMAGPVAGAAAGTVAAVLPAFVTRGQIVIVHTPAAAFTALAAAATWKALTSPEERRWLVLGGASAGCAFTSMYVAGIVAILVAAGAVAVPATSVTRVRRLAIAGTSAVAATVMTMPSWLFAPGQVIADIQAQEAIYARRSTKLSHVDALMNANEIGVVVALVAVIGLAFLVTSAAVPQGRVFVVTWTVAALVHVAFLARYDYQPLRTLLPVAVLLVLTSGVGAQALARRGGWWAGATAVAAVVVIAVWPGGLLERAIDDPHETDSRQLAVDAVRAIAEPDTTTLVAEELAILPSELQRIPGRVIVSPDAAFSQHLSPQVDIIVSGDPAPSEVARPGPPWHELATFGNRALPEPPGFWRTNDLRVRILVADEQGRA